MGLLPAPRGDAVWRRMVVTCGPDSAGSAAMTSAAAAATCGAAMEVPLSTA